MIVCGISHNRLMQPKTMVPACCSSHVRTCSCKGTFSTGLVLVWLFFFRLERTLAFSEGSFEGLKGPFVLALKGFEAFEAFEGRRSKGRLRSPSNEGFEPREGGLEAFEAFEGQRSPLQPQSRPRSLPPLRSFLKPSLFFFFAFNPLKLC